MKQKYTFALCFFIIVINNTSAQVIALQDYFHATAALNTNQIVIDNVLANDYINDVPATLSNVVLTQTTFSPFIELLADGSVRMLQDFTGNNSFYIFYEICDITNPNSCATNFIYISVGQTSSAAANLQITTQPNCSHPFATIQLSDFPVNLNITWMISISINGVEQPTVYSNGEDVTIENIPPGTFTFTMEDIIDGFGYALGGIYVPEPLCKLNLTFDGIITDANTNGVTDVGDIINYSFTASNYGTVPLTDISIDSETLTIIGGPISSLTPGSSNTTTFTAAHILTQTDINTNLIGHTAVVTATSGSETVTDNYFDTTILHTPDGIRFQAFHDYNNDGIRTNDESTFFYTGITTFNYETNNDGIEHHISAFNSTFTLYESNPATTYHLSMTIDPSYTSTYTVNTTHDITVPIGSGITTYLFPVFTIPKTDFFVKLTGQSAIRPDMATVQHIVFKNYGATAINSGALTYTKNSQLSITGISETVTNTATGFTYNFSNLQPNESRIITVTLQAPAIPLINIGDQLTSQVTATVVSSNEIYLENNQSILVQAVNNSYDPNDISESHGPKILHSTFSESDYLTYTIRFENTGNADAINIRVNDILDEQLDENSVRMVYASHNYVMDRIDNELNWTFDGINLEPSVENTEIGKGYIVFQVKPKPGYAVGDMIPNTASIYFDINPAIVTNTFETEFVSTLATTSFEKMPFSVYPNPTKDIVTILSKNSTMENVAVNDILGKTVLFQTVQNNSTQIDLSRLSNGMYFIKINAGSKQQILKVIKE